MRKLFFGCAVLLPLVAIVSCGGKQQPNAGDSTGAAVAAAGAELFDNNCVICHGGDGKRGMGGAADLSTSTISHAAGLAILKNGKGGMKAFGGELTDAEIEAVMTYAESLRKK